MIDPKRRFCLCSSACLSIFRVCLSGGCHGRKSGIYFTTPPPCSIRVILVLLAVSEGLF